MVEKEIGNAITIVLKFLLPATFGLVSLSPFLYGIIIDSSYNPNNEGSILIIFFSVSILVDFIYQMIVKIWNLEEKTIYIAFYGAFFSIINLIFTLIVLFFFRNYLLATFIYLITICIRTTTIYIFMNRKWTFKIGFKEILVSLLFSIIMGISVYLFISYTKANFLFLMIATVIGVIIYTVPMIITKQLERETRLILSFFKKHG